MGVTPLRRRAPGGSLAWRRAPIEHANAFAVLLEPHPKVQAFALEQIGDLLERLLPEILHLQDLALRLADEVAEAADVRVLERVHRPDRELEVVDRRLEQLLHARAIGARAVTRAASHRRRAVRAELHEVL